jgi:hypothetical protein
MSNEALDGGASLLRQAQDGEHAEPFTKVRSTPPFEKGKV